MAVSLHDRADGGGRDASIGATRCESSAWPSCLYVGVMRTLTFPPPKHGGVVVVTYPFLFEPR
jgi:hypothetical protein